MANMWEGRFKKELNKSVNDFNSSLSFDCRMYKCDINGSIAHAKMLAKQNIISREDSDLIIKTLQEILHDIENNVLEFDFSSEDIHMFVEAELTKRIGDTGKKLHTARSRNDQVALDIRMYLKEEILNIKSLTKGLIEVILNLSKNHLETIMPGYTHLQRAQPITFSHHLMAYASMFTRDVERLNDTYKRTNYSPLGSCALAGTTYPIDRKYVSDLLGFTDIVINSIDGVSDRDFVIELANTLSILMMHLSRFSEEIILWSSWEYKFIELDDSYSTGSSIMPQKKNPDIAELVRGKTGRVYGNLMSLLTTLKGLPLAYNKDMQEDKEAIFDSIDNCKMCVSIFTDMLDTIKVNKDKMKEAGKKGFINATDVADYLVKKGIPFRTAYKISGSIVGECIDLNITLDEYPLDKYKKYSELFEEDIYKAISLEETTFKRNSAGGPAVESVKNQIDIISKLMEEF